MNQQDFKAEIIQKTTAEIRTFLAQLAYETSGYKSLHNLTEQVEHQYHGRFLIELIQNAHDAMNELPEDENEGRLEILISQAEEPFGALYVANDGLPFTRSNFKCLSQLGQSDKDPQKSIGNKGIGFRSVLEICNSPEIYSRSSKDSGGFDGYCFRFDPDVTKYFEKPILDLIKGYDKQCSPLDDTQPLIEWSSEQLLSFRKIYGSKDQNWLTKELKYLSPYLLPIPIHSSNKTAAIKTFENQRFASVIRLPFKNLTARDVAIEMTQMLDENTVLFLDRVKFISLNSGEKMRLVERKTHNLNDPNNGQKISLEVIEDGAEQYIKKKYWLWSVIIGGEDNPEERDEIAKAIAEDGLPGRWPELRKATVSLAVSIDKKPEQGRINIFLPTQLPTGCAAHFNGPFYGDMSRTDINFNKKFNTLLLQRIGRMAVDIVLDSLAESDVDHARAILDILAPSSEEIAAGREWFKVVLDSNGKRELNLADQSIMLTEEEWTSIVYTSLLPELESPRILADDMMRNHATFGIIHRDLVSRKNQIKSLFKAFGVDPQPQDEDLAETVEKVADALHRTGENPDWNGFWYDLVSLFRNNAEPLKGRKILLGSDLDLHASDQDCTIFFPPRQGMDDDEIQIEGGSSDIPMTLRTHIAFLNDRIEIYNPEDARQQTPIRKFLESTLVQRYRVMEIIRSVLIPKSPELPIALESDKSSVCQDILLWGLKLVAGMPDRGKGRSGTLQLLRRLPVPCHGGWHPIDQSSFGPSWTNTTGTDVFEYLNGAKTRECKEALGKMLLPPVHKFWDGNAIIYKDLLELSGVFDGLKLRLLEPSDWQSTTTASKSSYELPEIPPPCIPDYLWNEYRESYSPKIRERMSYSGYFLYEVQSISIIPGLERYADFDEKTRVALMNSIFASIHKWEGSWLTAYVKKVDGLSQRINIESPLRYCLKSLPWISFDSDGIREWDSPSRRWYVPKIHLAGNRWQYAHLRPLPGALADKIDRNPDLYDNGLTHLGMPKFDPDPEEKTSDTRLLDDLALALASDIPHHDMFLNHIRVAWSNYEGNAEDFPGRIIISNGPKRLEAVKPEESSPVYLPDSAASFISELTLFSLPVIVINTPDAKRMSSSFKNKFGAAVRMASEMKVWPIVAGQSWQPEKGLLLSESELRWLPPVLLTLYAFVGTPPPGLYAKKLSGFVQLLHNASLAWVSPLNAGLWMGDEIIADPSVAAMWISEERLLVCDSNYKEQISKYAEALKTLIERDDLELPLKHVLEKIENIDSPSHEDICIALESLKIKPSQYDQVLDKWQGDFGSLIRMTISVIALLKADSELGVVADITNEEALLDYLQKLELSKTSPQQMLSLIRSCDDNFTLGEKLFHIFGEVAQLDKWNTALKRVGERRVLNKNAEDEYRNHLRSAQGLLQATIAYILRREGTDSSFKNTIEQLENIQFPATLTSQFWEIEFSHVIPSIVLFLEKLNAHSDEISAFKNSGSLEELKTNLLAAGVDTAFSPQFTHRQNHENFRIFLSEFLKIAVAACIKNNLNPLSWEKSPDELISHFEDFFNHNTYLRLISDSDFFRLVKSSLPREVGYEIFWDKVDQSQDLEFLMTSLVISPEEVDGADKELEKYKEDKKRQNRLTSVGGKEFDYAEENLSHLWNHIANQIKEDILPKVDLRNTSDLENIAKRTRKYKVRPSGNKKPKSRGRISKKMEHLIGFSGEIHAFRILTKTYGEEVVHPGAWKSSYSQKVFPGNSSDDSIGCDFIITQKKITYHVEVKSSADDTDSFELGSSEIRAAMEMTRKRKRHVFLIMHVYDALSENPGFRLLPNPYDPKCQGIYSIEDAGARIKYRVKS